MGAKFKWKVEELEFVFHIVNINPSKQLKDMLSDKLNIAINQKFAHFKKAHLGEEVKFIHEYEVIAFEKTRLVARGDSIQFVKYRTN